MSSADDDHDSAAGSEEPAGGDAAVRGQVAIETAERRLEALAGEMEQVVASCPSSEREALHDFAVSLVRDQIPVADALYADHPDIELEGDDASSPKRTGSAASLIGFGVLLLLVGFPLVIVFPFVGLLLVVAGAGMLGLGFLTFIFSKALPERTAAGE